MISLGWLPTTAFWFMLIFARAGSVLMLMPALGESTIPARLRLTFAMALSLVLYPLVSQELPPLPETLPGLAVLLGHEIMVGLIIGTIARLSVTSAQTAGSIIAFQAGLSAAQAADPTNAGSQGALVGAFISILGVTLIFATDLHHVAIAAIYESYKVFPPSAPLMMGDAATAVLESVAKSFMIGIQMSAPFIVFGLVFHLGMGILGKLMPQLQVYFITMPATVGVGLILMMLMLAVIMGLFIAHFEQVLAMLRGAGGVP